MTTTTPPSGRSCTRPAQTPSQHCAMLAVDIAAFGTRQDDDVQQHLRHALYRIIEHACQNAGLPPAICHREDRGDGILLITPPCISPETLIDSLASHIKAGIARHNKVANATGRLRLRMAVHAGPVRFDPNGASGQALIHLFRLLEAPAFKNAFDTTRSSFAIAVSHRLYEDVVRHGPGLIDPTTYRPITITLKETQAPAWICLSPSTTGSRQGATMLTRQPATTPTLTDGDIDTAWLIATGWTRERLANELGISPREAETRICRTLAKLCLADPADIAIALTQRLHDKHLPHAIREHC
ncbi:hypothetical protein GCM10023195_77510 [Actinoallomurus liliacearum]|uniref:HTH luxR-type domain-containing protein n=1 Tax=Actinoallomurus liliacearum TaxID=1080073 RepID=A0ABP8TXP2_9ACTN